MKKKVLLSSAALLAAVSLAACGNNSNSTSKTDSTTQQGGAAKEKVTLKLAALESGYGATISASIIALMTSRAAVGVRLSSSLRFSS